MVAGSGSALAVRAVTKRLVLRMFAAAPSDRFSLLDFDPDRREFRALVRAVAKRLRLGASAPAPPIFARFGLLNEGTFLGDSRFHRIET